MYQFRHTAHRLPYAPDQIGSLVYKDVIIRLLPRGICRDAVNTCGCLRCRSLQPELLAFSGEGSESKKDKSSQKFPEHDHTW